MSTNAFSNARGLRPSGTAPTHPPDSRQRSHEIRGLPATRKRSSGNQALRLAISTPLIPVLEVVQSIRQPIKSHVP